MKSITVSNYDDAYAYTAQGQITAWDPVGRAGADDLRQVPGRDPRAR